MRKRILFILVIAVISLAGCSFKKSVEDIINESITAHDQLKSFETEFTIESFFEEINGSMLYDIDNKSAIITFDHDDSILFIEKDDLYIVYEDDVKMLIDEEEIMGTVTESLSDDQNPLAFYTKIDEAFVEYFDYDLEDGLYKFSIAEDAENKLDLAENLMDELKEDEAFALMIEGEEYDIKDFSFAFTIDKETNLIQDIQIQFTPEFKDMDFEWNYSQKLTYINYDDVDQKTIEKFSKMETMSFFEDDDSLFEISDELEQSLQDLEDMLEEFDENEEENFASLEDLSAEEIKAMEDDAAAYLDALIQATVYQDVDEFVKRAPGETSKDEKRSEGEIQQTMFKEIYITNTMDGLDGAADYEDKIIEMTDAFLNAISTSTYEIIDAEAISADEIIVTISIEGINEGEIIVKAEEELYNLAMEDESAAELSDEELITKSIDTIIKYYNDADELMPAVEKEVSVMKQDK